VDRDHLEPHDRVRPDLARVRPLLCPDVGQAPEGLGPAEYQTDGHPRTSGPGFGVAVHPEVLLKSLRWRKPRNCFVDSMAHLMHAKVPTSFLAQVWAVMALTPQHSYQDFRGRQRSRRLSRSRLTTGRTDAETAGIEE
jgi:protein gp37